MEQVDRFLLTWIYSLAGKTVKQRLQFNVKALIEIVRAFWKPVEKALDQSRG